jgi:hypothetical protein
VFSQFFKHSDTKKKRKRRLKKKTILENNEMLLHSQWTNQEKDTVNVDGASI